MSIVVVNISKSQAKRITSIPEDQFSDVKAIEVKPSDLSKHISAFANSDGGDLYIGVDESGVDDKRNWRGFKDQEDANGHLQPFEKLFPLGTDFQYEFLGCDQLPGLVLHVQINKTQRVIFASNKMAYVRRGAQSLPVNDKERMKRLEYSKGVVSFEAEVVNHSKTIVTESDVVKSFIQNVVPSSTPEEFLRKQHFIKEDRPTVGCVLLFSDEPQAALPKRCGVKVYRYKTDEAEGFRESLAFTPKTVEGCLYEQIHDSVGLTTEVIESIPSMSEGGLTAKRYPAEALHEIITNAVLHRDYSVLDDVHIRIFDNRVEVQSPGRLPAHITVKNILLERSCRNGSIFRTLNKFPDPPNQDVGEGLKTAFNAMLQMGLKKPVIVEKGNSVLVVIKHEPLASPEEAIMDYLENNRSIKNAKARKISHIRSDQKMKKILGQMVAKGMIEQVPGTRRGSTAYQKPPLAAPDSSEEPMLYKSSLFGEGEEISNA